MMLGHWSHPSQHTVTHRLSQMPHRTSTTRLPVALRNQLEKDASGSTPTRRWSKQAVSRKTARKQERQKQKQRKAAFFSRHKSPALLLNHKRPAENKMELEVNRPSKRPRTSTLSSNLLPDVSKSNVSLTGSHSQGCHVASKEVSDLSASGTSHTDRKPATNKSRRTHREDDPEDSRISWFESKLGSAQPKGGKRSDFFGDGLDDLMGDLDRIVPMIEENSETHSESESLDESAASEFEGFEGISSVEGDSASSVHGKPQWGDSETIEDQVSDHIPQRREANDTVSTVVSAEPQAGARYVPPHLRERSADDSETLTKLSRRLKGLLNRLSEQNVASILISIEQIYRDNRRNDITSTLTDLIIDGVASRCSLLDSFVVPHACLIASLHKIFGVELAAHFVQCLVASYEDRYRVLRTSDSSKTVDDQTKGKECLNLVLLLSELYNFQVVSCLLIYDIIRSLLENLDEFDAELLLKIARNSGQQLRQDDPSALKDIVEMVQVKMSSKDQSLISSRSRFMIEMLTNLKNNKPKRTAGQDGRPESVDRMEKFLSGLSRNHHVLAHDPLRVTLDDLHSSKQKGKWWLVGSAWGGDPLLDRAEAADQQTRMNGLPKNAGDTLLKLARKQGMNTDVRRSIFVVLMSSDDYVDACDRLSQLSLTEVQQHEIIRVILHCLGNEREYNPYYTLLVQQLCNTSHSHKVTLQFCLWDFLRGLGEKRIGGAEIIKHIQEDAPYIAFDVKVSSTRLLNVARAYAWWLAKGCSSLTILKPVDFTDLQPKSLEFFQALFSQLFISTQVASPIIMPDGEASRHFVGPRRREVLEEVFCRATRVPALTQGLLYFFRTSLREDDISNNKVVLETLKWAHGVAKDTLRSKLDLEVSLT